MEVLLASRPQAFLVAMLAVLTLAFFSEAILRKKAGLSISTSLGLTMALCFFAVALIMLPAPNKSSNAAYWLIDFKHSRMTTTSASFWNELVTVSMQSGFLKWVMLFLRALAGAAVVMLGIPFVIMFYRKWFEGMATEAELQPGLHGFKAWASQANLVAVALVTVGAWLWAGYPILFSAGLWLLLLAAFPLYHWLKSETMSEEPVASEAPIPQPQSELERILRMVEVGKITGAEGAALIQALAVLPSNSDSSWAGYKFNRSRKAVALGALLVLVGFFLPWMKVNLAEEMGQILSSKRDASVFTDRRSGIGEREFEISKFIGKIQKMEVGAEHWAQAGGSMKDDIKLRGSHFTSGWVFLVLTGVLASLYLLPNRIPGDTRNIISVLSGTAAGIALAYTASAGMQFLAIGFVLCVLGFALVAVSVVPHLKMRRL